jgi:hypothetical protein
MISRLAKLLAGSLLCCFTAIVVADELSSGAAELYPSDRHYRASIRHIEGGGIGYNHGYTTFEAFLAPDPESLCVMPFLDVRGHVFNDGKMAANAGLGLRGIAGCRVYGLNAYYDYRNTKRLRYNQLGLGIETLGKRWDLRIDGYLPMGEKVTCPYCTEFVQFLGHQMILSQKYQFAMKGLNAEVGVHFAKSRRFDFYGAAGAYHFVGDIGPKVWGGKVRLVGKFKEYLTLGVSNSYDNMFHNRFQCELTVSVPFGQSTQKDLRNDCDISNLLCSRMVQPVERQEIIVVGKTKQCVAAIDPATGKPFNIVFVNNTSHSLGTYESPYPTLALAQSNSKPGDIIYVYPGNGTTEGMDAGITLQLNQKFWGSALTRSLETSQGPIVIPAQSTSAPTMTNIAGDGITLAAVNQVSGFIISGTEGNGISGTNTETINISECTIDGSQADLIHFENGGSESAATLSNLTLINSAFNAVFIDSAPAMTCTMNNCTIQDNMLNSLDASFANQGTVSIINNDIERNGGPCQINCNGPATVVFTGNNLSNHTATSMENIDPLIITAKTNPLTATIENNTISNNICGAMHFALTDTNGAQLNVNQNTITNNGSGTAALLGSALWIDPNNSGAGNCQLNLNNNIISDNGAAALYCFQGFYNDFQVNVSGNTITGNGKSGLVFANQCNTFSLVATNNTIANGGDQGITTGGGLTMNTAKIIISNNQITGNTNFANAIALSHDGTTLDLTVTDNNLSGNDTSGITLYAGSGIENLVVNIANNTISNNQNLGSNASGGIDLEQFINLSGSLTNNAVFNNGTPGVYIASTEASPYACLEMIGNICDTSYVLLSGSGTFNLAPCDVEYVNTGDFDPGNTTTAVQSCPDGAACPS